jgi:hypothetical protein
MFVYTDDILAIGENPKDILMKLNKYFKLKPDSIHPPDDYLGTKIKKTTMGHLLGDKVVRNMFAVPLRIWKNG